MKFPGALGSKNRKHFFPLRDILAVRFKSFIKYCVLHYHPDEFLFFKFLNATAERKRISMLEYEQVKERVNHESEILPSLVSWTIVGMVIAIVVSVFIFR
jgi:hypothetical protein